MNFFLFQGGYERRISCHYIPSQNGVMEHKNKQFTETGLSFLTRDGFTLCYLEYAFKCAFQLINKIPSKILNL